MNRPSGTAALPSPTGKADAARAYQKKRANDLNFDPSSALRACADHEGFVGIFRDLPPEISVIPESHLRIIDLLEVGVGRGGLDIDLVRCLQAGFHHRLAEWAQQRAVRNKALERLRIARVISRLNIQIGVAARYREQRLIGLRKCIPLFRVDEE